MAEEKAHKPTARKLEKARKEGKVLKSQLLTQAVSTTVLFAVSYWLLRSTWVNSQMLIEYVWSRGFSQPGYCLDKALIIFMKIVLGSLLVSTAASLLMEIVQVGVSFESSVLLPKLKNLDPASGVKRIWGGIKQSWQKLLNVVVLALVFFWFFENWATLIPNMFFVSQEVALSAVNAMVLKFMAAACITLLGLGGIEFLVKRKEFYRDLSMSDDEIRKEHKEMEGDPHVKSMRRALHEEIMMQDLVKRVRRSKVVVVEKE